MGIQGSGFTDQLGRNAVQGVGDWTEQANGSCSFLERAGAPRTVLFCFRNALLGTLQDAGEPVTSKPPASGRAPTL